MIQRYLVLDNFLLVAEKDKRLKECRVLPVLRMSFDYIESNVWEIAHV